MPTPLFVVFTPLPILPNVRAMAATWLPVAVPSQLAEKGELAREEQETGTGGSQGRARILRQESQDPRTGELGP